ncbi:MAG: hypothetical protein WBV94_21250, partial [Blastocatellia bacterium]
MKKNRVNSIKPDGTESAALGEVCLLSGTGNAAALMFPLTHDASKHVTQSTSAQYAPLGLVCPAETGRANARIKSNIPHSFFILLSSFQKDLSARLQLADLMYELNLPARLSAVAGTLPEPLAAYYRGLAALRMEQVEAAKWHLESAVSTAQGVYLTRSILALGAVAGYQGEYEYEMNLYADALKYKQDYFSYVETLRALAIYGQQQNPAAILERLYSVARKAPSQRLKLDVLNSLAVELHLGGKLREAQKIASVVCASPLAILYPQWRETQKEVARDLAEVERATIVIVAAALPSKQKPQQKVIIRFQYVESSARRQSLKPTIRRAPAVRSMIERVATVAPIHA